MGQARNWTNEEKQYLQDNWGMVSVPYICKKLNRSENAIKVMVQRLGLGAFLDAGDYVTWNQLQKSIGAGQSGGYKLKSWIANRGFPAKKKRIRKSYFKIVYIEDFWKWAEKNQEILDFSKMEENILGLEPEWAKQKRNRDFEKGQRYIKTPWTPAEDARLKHLLEKQRYSYDDLSKMIRRTNGAIQRRVCTLGLRERPVKADNTVKWTEQEFQKLGELIKAGYGYELLTERIGKSAKAIRGRVYGMYLTENLDKVREIMGTGKWGENRPERKINQLRVMDPQERADARDALIRLTAIIKHEFRQKLSESE